MRRRLPRFSTANLIDTAGPGDNAQLATRLGVTRSTISRWRNPRTTISIWQADTFAVKIGKHPSEIWSDWFDLSC